MATANTELFGAATSAVIASGADVGMAAATTCFGARFGFGAGFPRFFPPLDDAARSINSVKPDDMNQTDRPTFIVTVRGTRLISVIVRA